MAESRSKREIFENLRARIESDPEFARGLQDNLDAALERAGLTEDVRALRGGRVAADDEFACTTTCGLGSLTCAWTCFFTTPPAEEQ